MSGTPPREFISLSLSVSLPITRNQKEARRKQEKEERQGGGVGGWDGGHAGFIAPKIQCGQEMHVVTKVLPDDTLVCRVHSASSGTAEGLCKVPGVLQRPNDSDGKQQH